MNHFFLFTLLNVILVSICFDLNNSTWSFWLSVFFIWFIVSLWYFIYTITYQVLLEEDNRADGFDPKDKNK